MCTILAFGPGASHLDVVVEPARQPRNTIKSAAAINSHVSSVPPFEPTTPKQFGCSSDRLP